MTREILTVVALVCCAGSLMARLPTETRIYFGVAAVAAAALSMWMAWRER